MGGFRLTWVALLCRVALQLAKEDPGELLRRLCIIVLEDAVAHPALPPLVWLMAAQAKGYALTAAHVQLCLTVVYEVRCRAVCRYGGVPSGRRHVCRDSAQITGVSSSRWAAVRLTCGTLWAAPAMGNALTRGGACPSDSQGPRSSLSLSALCCIFHDMKLLAMHCGVNDLECKIFRRCKHSRMERGSLAAGT